MIGSFISGESYMAVDRTAQHVRDLAKLMNNPDGPNLGQWVARGRRHDDLLALHAFINGLGQDFDAVVAGLTLSHSSGAVEGHNT
jgi:transposase